MLASAALALTLGAGFVDHATGERDSLFIGNTIKAFGKVPQSVRDQVESGDEQA